MLSRLLVPALVVALLAPLAAVADAPESQEYVYTGLFVCATGAANPVNQGDACFYLRSSDAGKLATISVADDVFPNMGAYYLFKRGSTVLAQGSFCGATSAVVPSGTAHVVVSLYGPRAYAEGATPAGCSVVGSHGTISLALGAAAAHIS